VSDVITKIHTNADGTISIGTSQDVQGILDQNETEYNNNYNRTTRDTFGRKVASVPINIVNQWCKEFNCTLHQLMNDPMLKVKMYAKLRDPAYKKLRTDSGRI
jgi:hypothetical protein